MKQPDVTVCIMNHDYARFVGDAIESALGQRGVHVEVVVVDDLSSDDSVEVIAAYEPDITFVRRSANGGHAAAMNSAFAVSSGANVIFLDADDMLDPDCAATAVQAMGDAAKVHWRLRLVDGAGEQFGVNPSWRTCLADGDVLDDVLRTGWYATVPTSGNCFARWALEQLMPIPEEEFRHGGEAPLVVGAAFLGPVVAVEQPLASYRVHGSNDFASAGTISEAALRRRLEHAEILDRWLVEFAAERGHTVAPGTLAGRPDFRLMAVIEARLGTRRRVPWRERWEVAAGALRAADVGPRRRVLLGASGLAVGMLPAPAVRHVRDVAFAGRPILPWRAA